MKANILTSLLILFFTAVSFAQKPLDPKERKSLEFIYSTLHEVFSEETNLPGTPNTSFVFPWEKTAKMNLVTLNNIIDTLTKNLIIDKEEKGLIIASTFPANVDIDNDLYSIKVTGYDLRNEKGVKIRLDTNVQYNSFGSESKFSSSSIDSNSTPSFVNYKTITQRLTIRDEFKHLKGVVNIRFSIIKEFEYTKISKSDTGDKIYFAGQNIDVTHLKKGVAILSTLKELPSFKHIVTNNDNFPYDPLKNNKVAMTEEGYKFFSDNPRLTLEEFISHYELNPNLSKPTTPRNLTAIISNGEIINLYLYRTKDLIKRQRSRQLKL